MGSLTASSDLLRIDASTEAARLEEWIRQTVFHRLRKRGAVVGLSGGIDSALVAFLCARALGPDRVVGLFMPEAESSPESLLLGQRVAERLGIETVLEDIAPILNAARCYQRRDEAVRALVPDYGEGCRMKIVLPGVLDPEQYAVFYLVVQFPSGERRRLRMRAETYLSVVAATNFKQRARKMIEYHHADRLNYAVAGTPNRLEYDQGFFVKHGDGAADFKPIAHLYKTQVYQLAQHLGVPEEVRRRPPTTDTYSLEQSQEEFFFSLPLADMDVCLYAYDHQIPAAAIAASLGLTPEQAARAYRGIESRRRLAAYLHAAPAVVEPIGCEALP